MTKIIIEEFSNDTKNTYLRNFGFGFVLLAVITFYWELAISLVTLIVGVPLVALWVLRISHSPIRIELKESTNDLLIVSRGGAQIWQGAVADIKNVHMQSGRIPLVILSLVDGESFSFSFYGMSNKQMQEVQSWIDQSK